MDNAAEISPPAPTAEAIDHRSHRSRRLLLGILSSLVTRPLGYITPLVTVPLFLSYLGQTKLGLSDTVGEMAAYLGMTNLGLSLGLINRLADCAVHDDKARARKYVSTLTIFLLFVICGCALLWTVASFGLPWGRAFKGFDSVSNRRELSLSLWVAGIATLLNSLASLAPSIYAGYQETHRISIWDAVIKVATLVACFAVTFTRFGVPGVIVASSGLMAILWLANLGRIFLFEKPWLRPRWSDYDRTVVGELLKQGLMLLGVQASMGLAFSSSKTVIGYKLGLDQVPPFGTLQKLFIPFYGIVMLMIVPLWSATSDAIRRGDLKWVRKSFRYSSLIGPGLMLAVGASMLIVGDRLIHLLARGHFTVSRSMIIAFTLLFAIRASNDCRSIVLNAMDVIGPQLLLYLANGIVNIVLALILAPRYGLEGVAWAMTMSCVVTTFWGYPWLLRRHLKRLPAPVASTVVMS